MANKKRKNSKKDIFFELIGEEEVLIYAPLAGLALRTSSEEAENIKKAAFGLLSTQESVDAWNMLRAKDSVLVCSSPIDIDEMTILFLAVTQ